MHSMAKLTGPQAKQLQEAILDAFDREELKELLLLRLDKKLDRIAPGATLDATVLDVIQKAEREGWTADLLRAVAAERPSRKDLQSLVAELLTTLEGGKVPPESTISSVPSTPQSNLGPNGPREQQAAEWRKEAETALAAGDLAGAELAVRQSLQLAPWHAAGLALLAQVEDWLLQQAAEAARQQEEEKAQRRQEAAQQQAEAAEAARKKAAVDAAEKAAAGQRRAAELAAAEAERPGQEQAAAERAAAEVQRKPQKQAGRPAWQRWPLWAGLAVVAVVGFLLLRNLGGGVAPAPQVVEKVVTVIVTTASTTSTALQATVAPAPTTPKDTPVSTAAPDLGIGSTMVADKDGMELVYVPAGEFLMGSGADDAGASDVEKPQHTVDLDAYWIDKTEVTNAQYGKCVEAGGCAQPGGSAYSDGGKANHPVVYVSWNDAKAYCEWAERRLPSEAEWEKAARGTDGRRYPWGNDFDGGKLNYCDKNCTKAWKDTAYDDGYELTAPVGSYAAGASPYWALDMAGNVWEWVGDWYANDYYAIPRASNPSGPAAGDGRVLRGGSWINESSLVRAAGRLNYIPATRYDGVGFRCARSL